MKTPDFALSVLILGPGRRLYDVAAGSAIDLASVESLRLLHQQSPRCQEPA
jgi:hypothetical protein